MENFLLPSKIEFFEGDTPSLGSVVVMPCYHGYATTLGNAYRRVLLSSLPGSAVEYFKIKGVEHEFTTAEGVKEDIVEIMLNLKQLAVKVFSDEPVKLNLVKKGPGPVTAADIEKNSDVEVANKNLVICNLTSNKIFEMEIVVGKGRGYRPVEEKDRKNYDLGTMVVDSVYTPVKDVGYHVEYTRVGDITNYEKLTINIETNGTISPREALRQATQILMDHFTVISESVEQASATEVFTRETVEAAAIPEITAEEASPDEEAAKTEKKEKKAKAKVKKASKK
ncbi:MAG: DNA-directed RNA polymerase subunit alpha [Candidatus Magasanikbacteria bacterium]|nr:DNA-directed RNA polymerase subunit alpha [Candidatus Magasanikbacteria bacterium]